MFDASPTLPNYSYHPRCAPCQPPQGMLQCSPSAPRRGWWAHCCHRCASAPCSRASEGREPPPESRDLNLCHGPVSLVTWDLLSGKHTKNDGQSPCSVGKLTISMAIFNSYVSHYQRVWYGSKDGIWMWSVWSSHAMGILMNMDGHPQGLGITHLLAVARHNERVPDWCMMRCFRYGKPLGPSPCTMQECGKTMDWILG